MRQVVFANVSIDIVLVDSYIDCFFDGSNSILTLHSYNLGSSPHVMWSVVFWCSYIGGHGFKCSLNLSPKVLNGSPVYSSSHYILSHLYEYMTPLFCVALSLGDTRRFFKVFPTLKCTLTPYLLDS